MTANSTSFKRKHGHATGQNSRTYTSWLAAKNRCSDPTWHSYHRYGGRGIKVCDQWRDDFAQFLADMGERPPNTSLERIDFDGDYEPGNCKWATQLEQAINQKRVIIVMHNGDKLSLLAYAKVRNVPYPSLYHWVRRKGLDPVTAADQFIKRHGL